MKGSYLFNLSNVGLQFLGRELGRRKMAFTGFVFLSGIAAIIEMTGVGLVFPLLILVVEPNSLERFPLLASWLAQSPDWLQANLTFVLLGLIGVILVSKNVFMLGFNWTTQMLLAKCKSDLSNRLIATYLFADYRVHLRKSTSEIIRNMSLVVAVYDQFIANALGFVVNIMILLGLCTLLVWLMPPNTLVSLVIIVALTFFSYRAARGYFEKAGEELNMLFKERQTILRQSIGLIKETKVMAKEDFFCHAYSGIEQRNFNRIAKNNFISSIPPLVIEAAILIAVLTVVFYLLLTSNEVNVGLAILGAMAAALFRLMPVLNKCLSSMQMLNLGRSGLEIIAAELEELEGEDLARKVPVEPVSFKESIEFRNVSFCYPSGEFNALTDVSFTLNHGEKIGITGESGSGKSTLGTLLLGLMVPDKGEIRVDGVLLNHEGLRRGWQRLLGYVPQNSFILEDTIAANVAFGEKAEDVDRERVWKALDLVNMRNFVEALPCGVDEFLYEDGIRISGGQKQRLNIARILYLLPEVLLLDEATSGLDAENEIHFIDNLDTLADKTVIIIAHRLNTLRDCDKIIMMKDGYILDCAPFEVLVDRCPEFKSLVEKYNLRLPSNADDIVRNA